MSLQQKYMRFLAAPTPAALDTSASLYYITTVQSVESGDAIAKHLVREGKQMKKRVEKTLSSVETEDSLVLEVETEIQFISDGGFYLPALDDNFVVDNVITLPIIHFVKFEGPLVKQIRLHWDQGNVLKQLGVIGRNGRNWPITEGKDQIKLISKSLSQISVNEPAAKKQNGSAAPAPTDAAETISPQKSASNGKLSLHATRDPHASLHLFGTEEEPEAPPAITPRAQSTYKPPNRDLTAIIGEPDEAVPEIVSPPKARSTYSHYQTFELGENGEDEIPTPKQVQKVKKVDPKKYAHFEFGDGEDVTEKKPAVGKYRPAHVKHGSSWAFEDFSTPEKKPIRLRKGDERHFGWSEDSDVEVSPVKYQNKPRKDANAHFDFESDTPGAPLANVSNKANNARRDADSHFEIADHSPANTGMKKELAADRKAAVKMMSSQWGTYDNSESEEGDFFTHFGASEKQQGIRIAGNGQGQRKGLGSQWTYNNEETADAKKENVSEARSSTRGSRKQTDRSSDGFWDF